MDWKDVKKELLSDPEFRAEYERLHPQYQIISAIIKQRQRQRMTQKQLAQRLGTSQSVIARLEAGKANVTIETLQRVAEALDCCVTFGLKPRKSQDNEDPHRQDVKVMSAV